jgi:hypothetical protein
VDVAVDDYSVVVGGVLFEKALLVVVYAANTDEYVDHYY